MLTFISSFTASKEGLEECSLDFGVRPLCFLTEQGKVDWHAGSRRGKWIHKAR